jgi:hypothetical protein
MLWTPFFAISATFQKKGVFMPWWHGLPSGIVSTWPSRRLELWVVRSNPARVYICRVVALKTAVYFKSLSRVLLCTKCCVYGQNRQCKHIYAIFRQKS